MWENNDIWSYEEHSQHSLFTIKFGHKKIVKMWSYEEHSHFTIKFQTQKILKIWHMKSIHSIHSLQSNSEHKKILKIWSYAEHSQHSLLTIKFRTQANIENVVI